MRAWYYIYRDVFMKKFFLATIIFVTYSSYSAVVLNREADDLTRKKVEALIAREAKKINPSGNALVKITTAAGVLFFGWPYFKQLYDYVNSPDSPLNLNGPIAQPIIGGLVSVALNSALTGGSETSARSKFASYIAQNTDLVVDQNGMYVSAFLSNGEGEFDAQVWREVFLRNIFAVAVYMHHMNIHGNNFQKKKAGMQLLSKLVELTCLLSKQKEGLKEFLFEEVVVNNDVRYSRCVALQAELGICIGLFNKLL